MRVRRAYHVKAATTVVRVERFGGGVLECVRQNVSSLLDEFAEQQYSTVVRVQPASYISVGEW